MSKPLEGYKVIEFSTYVAGPTAGRLLADWGAEVIKVEAPKGDVWRYAVYQSTEEYASDENPIYDVYNMVFGRGPEEGGKRRLGRPNAPGQSIEKVNKNEQLL